MNHFISLKLLLLLNNCSFKIVVQTWPSSQLNLENLMLVLQVITKTENKKVVHFHKFHISIYKTHSYKITTKYFEFN